MSKVLANLKDHKDAGSIGFRVLHSGAGHPLACLEKFLVSLVRPFLKDIAFINSSTDSVQRAILETRFPINAKFVKIDLKDYFNQGTPEDLSNTAFKHISHPLQRAACTKLSEDLFWQQFVSSEVVGKIFCAVRGSGQGRVLSFDFADKHFYHLVEENLWFLSVWRLRMFTCTLGTVMIFFWWLGILYLSA